MSVSVHFVCVSVSVCKICLYLCLLACILSVSTFFVRVCVFVLIGGCGGVCIGVVVVVVVGGVGCCCRCCSFLALLVGWFWLAGFGWLVGWRVGWFEMAGWSVGRLAGWLVGEWVAWLACWLFAAILMGCSQPFHSSGRHDFRSKRLERPGSSPGHAL